MTTKTIKKNDSSFTVSTVKPLKWSNSATVTADVIGLDGTILDADAAVTVYAGGVTGADAVAGEYDIVLAVDNSANAGDKIAIGSALSGWQERIVDGYVSATKTLTLTECLDEDVDTGGSVVGLDMSFTVDTTESQYDDIEQVQVYWKPDGDDVTMSELWRFQSVENQPSNLRIEFDAAYPTIGAAMSDNATFEILYTRAKQWLITKCKRYGADYTRIVDNEASKEILINRMALMSGTGYDISVEMYDRIKTQFEDNWTEFRDANNWIDEDQDSIMDEGETESLSDSAPISRGL
jgi:hypothetical protein